MVSPYQLNQPSLGSQVHMLNVDRQMHLIANWQSFRFEYLLWVFCLKCFSCPWQYTLTWNFVHLYMKAHNNLLSDLRPYLWFTTLSSQIAGDKNLDSLKDFFSLPLLPEVSVSDLFLVNHKNKIMLFNLHKCWFAHAISKQLKLNSENNTTFAMSLNLTNLRGLLMA
jgi:hypothetical protein